MPQRMLRVYANPYAHIDAEGRPAGAVPEDPTLGSQRAWVGASLDNDKSEVVREFPEGDPRFTETNLVFKFETGAIEVPDTIYYRQRIREGSLIAADDFTAKKAGLEFVDPEEALGAAKRERFGEWVAGGREERPEWAAGIELEKRAPAEEGGSR